MDTQTEENNRLDILLENTTELLPEGMSFLEMEKLIRENTENIQ
jgi:hypothetical protein